MSHTITVRDGVFHVHVADPTRVIELEMAPGRLETRLTSGDWLVLAFAVWSGPDREAVDLLCDLASAVPQDVALGVRPFLDHHEFDLWCPLRPATCGSPIWIVLRNGNSVAQRHGMFERDDVAAWLSRAFS
jgi:hypothetical protein